MSIVLGPIAPAVLAPAGQPRLFAIGTSITAVADDVQGNEIQRLTRGYLNWARCLTRQRFDCPQQNNFGESGATTAVILENLPALLAVLQPGDVVIVEGGTNDDETWGVDGPGVTTGNLATIYDAIYRVGCPVIAIPILSRTSDAVDTWDDTQRSVALAINQWIREQVVTRRAFFVAETSLLFDDPAASPWAPRTGYTLDGLHPSTIGAHAVALAVNEILEHLYPNWVVPVASPTDVYNATTYPRGNLLANGMLTGTGGTAGGTSTGDVATSWSSDGTLLGGATCALSKGTKADGRVEQIVTLSGAYTGTARLLSLNTSVTTSNLAAGDKVQATVDVVIGANEGISSVECFLQSVEGGTTYRNRDMHPVRSLLLPAAGFSGVLRTPPRVLTAVPSSAFVVLRINFFSPGDTTTIAGEIRFASVALRKLP